MLKRMTRLIFRSALSVFLVALFMVPVVYAQEDKDKDTFTLQEITVTAEKREANLQKTPISIQAVSGEQLSREGKQRIDDIMQGIPGVSSQGSQVGSDFYMRGIGTGNFGPPTGGIDQSAVAVLIDGVYQNRGEVVRGGTLDMKRAEVMRGTQSTTLGGSSLAGAVSLVSNEPVFKYEGYGSLELGNYHLVNTSGVLNVPFTDNQAARIAYSNQKRDGYLESNAGNSDLTNARLKYRWQATDALNLVATFNHQDIGGNGVDNSVLTYYGYWEGYDSANASNYDGTMGNPKQFGHVSGVKYDQRHNPWDDGYPANQWPNNPYRDTKIDQYSADINWNLGFGTLTVVPSYQSAHFQSTEPPRDNTFRSENRKQKTTQVDARLASPDSAPFKWLGGFYYYDTRFSGSILTTTISPPTGPGPPASGSCTNPTSNDEYTYCWSNTDPNIQTTYAAYGNLTYPILDKLNLDAGLRYTHDKKSVRASDNVGGTDAGPSSAYTYSSTNSGEGTWNDVSYRIGTEYNVTDQAMIYVMYNTGYQPGLVQVTPGGTSTTDKQTLDQWTAGVKSRWIKNSLEINVEGFHETFHNRPLDGGLGTVYSSAYPTGQSCGNGPGTPYTVASDGSYACYAPGSTTVPDMVSKGVDVQLNWIITDKDRLDTSTEYKTTTEGTPDLPVTMASLESVMSNSIATELYNQMLANAATYDGLTMQNAPKWSFNASYSHIFDLPDGSTLTPQLNAEFKSSYWSLGGGPGANIAQPGDSVQDKYWLWNAYLSWTSADQQFNISAYAKNIGNKAILTNMSPSNPMFGQALEYVTLGAPRTFGVIFSVNL